MPLVEDRPTEPAPLTPRAITLSVATVVTALLVATIGVLPVPYAISGPGPTLDTLGETDGHPLIEIHGAPVYESSGELLLTTAAIAGGPGFPVTLVRAMRGWVDGTRAVTPVEQHFPPSSSRDETTERNQAEMITSQEVATVVALEELGYQVPTTLNVSGVVEGSGADGVVRAGDVVVSLDGKAVSSFADLARRMAAIEPGTTVAVGVQRGGAPLDLAIPTTDDGQGGALLGVLIDPEFELPIDVSIRIDEIGGASAGTMFTLGIIDKLTEEDEANGAVIAGTGTMELTGQVGRIGAIRQKLVGAAHAGAAWFLAPVSNCDEVVGHVPDGLRVVAVSTITDARAAVEAIGAGTGGTLPTCD